MINRTSCINSVFIGYNDIEWCCCMVCIGSPALVSFTVFLFFLIFNKVYFELRYRDKFVSIYNTTGKLLVDFLLEMDFLQPYLVINVTVLV